MSSRRTSGIGTRRRCLGAGSGFAILVRPAHNGPTFTGREPTTSVRITRTAVAPVQCSVWLGGVPSAFHLYTSDFAGIVESHRNNVVRHIIWKREVKAVHLVIAAPM